MGEAAVCWLARWGIDMLQHELSQASAAVVVPIPTTSTPVPSAATPSRMRNVGLSLSLQTSLFTQPPTKLPHMWRRGGLSSKWVKAILSSDAFFVSSERERYSIACQIVEIRRQDGINEEEEKDWDDLFTKGIYYVHMVNPFTFLASTD